MLIDRVLLTSVPEAPHYKKSLKFRGTKLLENRLFLLGMSLFFEELMSWKNSWLQSHYRGNFQGTFVSEEEYPRNIDLTTEPQTDAADTKVTKISEEVCPRNVFYFKKQLNFGPLDNRYYCSLVHYLFPLNQKRYHLSSLFPPLTTPYTPPVNKFIVYHGRIRNVAICLTATSPNFFTYLNSFHHFFSTFYYA